MPNKNNNFGTIQTRQAPNALVNLKNALKEPGSKALMIPASKAELIFAHRRTTFNKATKLFKKCADKQTKGGKSSTNQAGSSD
jgi:hypothetical protein